MSGHNFEWGGTTQNDDYSVSIDGIVKPPITVDEGLADFLYGGMPGRAVVRVVMQHNDSTHVELKSPPQEGTLVAELAILIARFEKIIDYPPVTADECYKFRRISVSVLAKNFDRAERNNPEYLMTPFSTAYKAYVSTQ